MLQRQPEPSEMDPAVQKILREPFAKEQIGQLPRITCNDCRNARGKVCDRHTKSQCTGCGNWITGAHMHLSYVGHAAVTDRLLKADPGWSWEPAYRDVDPHVLAAACASGDPDIVAMVIENSPPLTDGATGMWIKLTVGGVTRLGYGADEDPGADHDKKLVSDALRNAGMRFGVGLDLWSKEDLGTEEPPASPPVSASREPGQDIPQTGTGRREWVAEAGATTDLDALLTLGRECAEAGFFTGGTRTALIKRRRELEASPQGPVAA